MESRMPVIIDLNAELARLTMFRRTPQSTREETKGSVARLASYRDGFLFAIKFSGKDHWERHLTGDELVHILDGTAILDIVCDAGPPESFALRAGMMAVIPKGAWHRFYSSEGATQLAATPFPGENIELDVDNPRAVEPKREKAAELGMPGIVDLETVVAKLGMFRGRTPQSTMADRKGRAARLATYRDGALSVTRFAGKGHWERHPADELVHILDGSATLEIVCDDGPPKSFALGAGMIAVNRQAAWHRFYSSAGVTLMTATPSPSEVIELDVDDPREAAPRLATEKSKN
jgi:mannose-6-phosphate isomerase-like protein (cupin superfamily)